MVDRDADATSLPGGVSLVCIVAILIVLLLGIWRLYHWYKRRSWTHRSHKAHRNESGGSVIPMVAHSPAAYINFPTSKVPSTISVS